MTTLDDREVQVDTVVDDGHTAIVEELARVRALLTGQPHTRSADRTKTTLDAIAARLELTAFERDTLMLAAAVELDPDLAATVAAAQDGRAHPTGALALATLPEPHWDALSPTGPLRWWRLVEMGNGATLADRPLTIDERILHLITGVDAADERLDGIVADEPIARQRLLCDSHASLVTDLADTVTAWVDPVAILLDGDDHDGRRAVATALAAAFGARPLVVRTSALPATGTTLAATCRLLDREAALCGRLLVLDAADDDRPVTAVLAMLRARVVVVLSDGVTSPGRLAVRRDVAFPSPREQRTAWHDALSTEGMDPTQPELSRTVEEMAAHYRFSVAAVAAIAQESAAAPQRGDVVDEVRRLARRRARVPWDALAERIEPVASWDDLVLPPGLIDLLRAITAQVRHRATVYDEWGFGRGGPRGLGVTALFAGESGTGKTLAAEVVAGDLGLDLYRIDLASVVDKYIGETEKNLRRVFDAAEAGGAVLLFDEADALFGKRGEVRDAHDRYANLQVAYLLQRMESYRGLAVLTTNLRSALDPAFVRRLRFVVQFPFPDEQCRAQIWARAFPPQAATKGLDPERLAAMHVTGASIRSIALGAAFLAATDGTRVTPAHVLAAARVDYAKHDRTLTDAERAGWGT